MEIYKIEPADAVDPNIGTIGHLLTATEPTVALPCGMARVVPVTEPGVTDRYLADKLYGFSTGPAVLMPAAGRRDPFREGASFDHDLETAAPYYYSVLLEEEDIQAEYTVAHHSACFRFTFAAGGDPFVYVRLPQAALKAEDPGRLAGSAVLHGVAHYIHIEFSRPFLNCRFLPETPASGGEALADVTAAAEFSAAPDEPLGVKIGISLISAEQAYKNLREEMGGWNFEQAKAAARAAWNRALRKITVKGGTAEQRTVFYTALYRSLLHMADISEDGRYFSGFDGRVHDDGGHPFYNIDNIWDTYRTMHPLQLLLDPGRQADMIRSYLRMYEQCGWLPQFPDIGGDRPIMTGNHTAAMIADAYFKGCRDFDLEKAYEAVKKNAMEVTMLPWVHGPLTELDEIYLQKGYFPAIDRGETERVSQVHPFERRQAVSVTLEHAYDDWCAAQLAKELNRMDDCAYFLKRSQNYRNVFNPEAGFMAPKTAAGKWVENFDPVLDGGQGGRDYFTECNSWIYTFHVQHDIAGLTDLLGGKRKLEERLDRLFTEPRHVSKYEFLARFPDETGLMGLYCQGNEPAFHIPYLYNYAGAPWKTQRRVREIMKLWYRADPLGICGDEDAGAMSSWYVFSAMGFYPVCPGKPVYDLGSPIFDETEIDLGNGKFFSVRADGVSEKNKYIQSAELNGKPLNLPWLRHADIAEGGTLILQMGARPNKRWGI